jgi:hypothetical protein
MVAESGLHDWRYLKVREWLLLLLRFAVTRDPSDEASALALAFELDSLGPERRAAEPRFFLRRSLEVCEAIPANGRNNAILRTHAERIDDLRLRRAFQVAVGLPMKLRTAGTDTRTETRQKSEAARRPVQNS